MSEEKIVLDESVTSSIKTVIDEKGRILLRILPEWKERLEEIAKEEDESVTSLIKTAIRIYYKL